MNLRIVSLIVAILLYSLSYAQVSKESYEKAVNFLNCKTVELSLSEDKIENYKAFQEKCNCDNADFKQINQFLDSVNLTATLALANEIDFLKNQFKENWGRDEAVTLLSASIFNDEKKYKKVFAFADKRKGKPELETYKASLNAELGKIILEINQRANASSSNTSNNIQQTTEEENLKNQINEDEGFLGGLSDYLIMLALILGALGLMFGLINRDTYNKMLPKILVSNRLKDLIQLQISHNRNTPSNQSNTFELRDANNRIRDLESQITNLKDSLNSLSDRIIKAPQEKLIFEEVKQPELKTETLFLSTPNSDGSFNESSAASSYREGATIYRFTKTKSDKAKFQIDEKETSIKFALQYPDKNIDPVCEAENAFNPRATKIFTVQEGEAQLRDGKWIINNKAIIRYEN